MVLLHLQPPLQPGCLFETAYFLKLQQYLKTPSRTRPHGARTCTDTYQRGGFSSKGRRLHLRGQPHALAEIHLLPSVSSLRFILLLTWRLGSYCTTCIPICHYIPLCDYALDKRGSRRVSKAVTKVLGLV